MSTAFGYDRLSSQIGTAQSRMTEAQNRVVTGKRIERPSDDASGTKTLIGVNALQAGTSRYKANLDVAKGVLASSEATYSDMGDLLQQARTLAVQGATTAMDDAGREAIARQIETLQNRLVDLGNSQAPDGRYLFGGRLTDAKPFSVGSDGKLAYAGDNVVPTMQTGPGASAGVGEAAGGIMTDAFTSLERLKSSLRSADVTAISNDRLKEVDDSLKSFTSARADVGRRLDAVATTRGQHERRETELGERASDIGEVDYASAILDYTAAQSAYEAALQVASKGFSMGLMDFIR